MSGCRSSHVMAATCCTGASQKTLRRRTLRTAYRDRLQKALFVVDLQLNGIRQSIADLKGSVVLKKPLSRKDLLQYSPLHMSRTPDNNCCEPCQIEQTPDADQFVPEGEINEALEHLAPTDDPSFLGFASPSSNKEKTEADDSCWDRDTVHTNCNSCWEPLPCTCGRYASCLKCLKFMEVPASPHESHGNAKFQGKWEQLPFFTESAIPILRTVSTLHATTIEEISFPRSSSNLAADWDDDAEVVVSALPPVPASSGDSSTVFVQYDGKDSPTMGNIIEVFEPYGDIDPVDWCNTPDGLECVTLLFPSPAEASRACSANINEIVDDRGKRIKVKVFQ